MNALLDSSQEVEGVVFGFISASAASIRQLADFRSSSSTRLRINPPRVKMTRGAGWGKGTVCVVEVW